MVKFELQIIQIPQLTPHPTSGRHILQMLMRSLIRDVGTRSTSAGGREYIIFPFHNCFVSEYEPIRGVEKAILLLNDPRIEAYSFETCCLLSGSS